MTPKALNPGNPNNEQGADNANESARYDFSGFMTQARFYLWVCLLLLGRQLLNKLTQGQSVAFEKNSHAQRIVQNKYCDRRRNYHGGGKEAVGSGDCRYE